MKKEGCEFARNAVLSTNVLPLYSMFCVSIQFSFARGIIKRLYYQ